MSLGDEPPVDEQVRMKTMTMKIIHRGEMLFLSLKLYSLRPERAVQN
jgi:hypothetical protein